MPSEENNNSNSLNSSKIEHLSITIDEESIPFRKIPSDDNLNNIAEEYSVLGFSTPLSIEWFFSVVGTEYCHIYFWLLKDLAWMQSWLYLSISFGTMALLWSLLILYHSLRTLNWHEVWNFIALFLWLFANFWWMLGEAHDYEFPDEIPISVNHTYNSAIVLFSVLIWELFYYMIILPFNLLPCSKNALLEYDDGVMRPHFPCFKNFRQYENLHMLFWIAKDLAWNRLQFKLWLCCVVPTILIAADFIYLSVKYCKQDCTVDITHFAAVLIWVAGNSLWAYGDFFIDDGTASHGILEAANHVFRSARYYSSWILFIGLIPIFIMYGVWGTLTLSGRLNRFKSQQSEVREEETALLPNTKNSQLSRFSSSARSASPGLVLEPAVFIPSRTPPESIISPINSGGKNEKPFSLT